MKSFEEAPKRSKPQLEAEAAANPHQSASPRSREQQFKPAGITGNEAWRIMEDEKIESVAALVRRLKVDGITISEGRLCAKLRKVPGYYAKFLAAKTIDAKVREALEVTARLADMAQGANAKALHGMYTVLILRLEELVPIMTPEQADGMIKLFSLGEKITGLMHDLRGLEINAGNTPAADDGIDIMNLVNVLPIRKPRE